MKKTRLLLLLVLLMTAATGARAAWTGGTYTATANENLGAITVNGDATLTINSDVTVTVTGGINVASGTLTVTGPGTLVVTGAKGNNGASGWKGSNGGNGGVAISGNIIVQGGATVTATGGTGGNGGNGELEAGNGGNGGVAFAGTLTYKSGTVTANGGSAGSGGYIEDEEEYASSGSAGKAFANDVDFTQTTGYSVTNGTSTIGSVLNQRKVVISGGSEPAAASGYTVSLKDGVKDADKWTISPNPAPEGSPVTIQYTGRLKVKGVTATSDAAPAGKTVDLSTLTADYEAKDGDVLTGTLANNVKISIAAGATVTLDGVNISNGQIACSGNANIILMGANTVTAASEKAAIKIGGPGTTLTITGSGSLTAQGGKEAAGIGTDRNENGELSFGNIVINGGTVTATGGNEGAGIGTGLADGQYASASITCGDITINGGTVTAIGGLYGAGIGTGTTMSDGGSASITCGDITINGGTVTATGGDYGPGIGTGVFLKYGYETASNRCGNITIGAGVTSVTATKGSGSPNSIGKGYAYGGTQNYGTITIGGTVYATGVTTSPYTYDPTAQAKPAATVTLTLGAMSNGGDPFSFGTSGSGAYSQTFAVGGQIAIIYKNTSNESVKVVTDALTAADISNEGMTATINVTIDDADKTQGVTYIYPAAMANDDGTINYDFTNQNGTVTAIYKGSGAWDGDALPSVSMASQIAIFKFTTKNANGSATIDVNSLTITIGAQNYVITPASATSELYVALPAVADQAVRFSAKGSDSKTYTCSKASVTFAAGKYYQSMLKMAPPITVTWNNNDITGSGNSFSKDGVTITAGSIDFDDKSFEENGTFTTTRGNFTKIEVVATDGFCDVIGTGWSGDEKKRTWTGNASSVSFIGDIYSDGADIKFVFTIEP